MKETHEQYKTFEGKEVHRDKIRVSRAAEEEYFLIETDIIAPLDNKVVDSKVIFFLPDSHPVFEVPWGEDLSVGGDPDDPQRGGPLQAVVRLKGEWFWGEQEEFDYHIIITTSNGNYEETGRAVVR